MTFDSIPKTATVSCPLKEFKSRYIVKGCMNCDYFGGLKKLVEADEIEVKDIHGQVTGKRKLEWHEKFVIVCGKPMTRRCSNIEIIEE